MFKLNDLFSKPNDLFGKDSFIAIGVVMPTYWNYRNIEEHSKKCADSITKWMCAIIIAVEIVFTGLAWLLLVLLLKTYL